MTKSSLNLKTGPQSGFLYTSQGRYAKVFRCTEDAFDLRAFELREYKRVQQWLWMGTVSDVAPGTF